MKSLVDIQRIHFVGIGGISMSALATLVLSLRKEVSGSEDNISPLCVDLIAKGIPISKFSPQKVRCCDLVIYTIAVPLTHPDLVLAEQLEKPILERAHFLGIISDYFNERIAVAGTHGKTTTTAMLATIMERKNPTAHIGGILPKLGSNLRLGSRHFFITEACEFNKSFLHLHPTVALITNIECDHMDCYKDKTDLNQTFLQFYRQTRDLVVINHNFSQIFDENFANSKVQTFDIDKKCDFWACELEENLGCFSFECYNQNFHMGRVELKVLGRHNVMNALGAIAVATHFGIDFYEIQQKIKEFTGTQRRFEILWENGFKIIHDYAHHPTEIKCSIETARLLKPERLVCIFEPHTYTRTLALMPQFQTCFEGVDELLLLPTYSAREKPIAGGTAFDLFKNLPEHINSTFFESAEKLEEYLLENHRTGDLQLWLGAGTIEQFAKNFVKKLQKI